MTQYHHDYIALITRLIEKASEARALAEVNDIYIASRLLRQSAAYLKHVYHLAPPEVAAMVNQKLSKLPLKTSTVSEYFSVLDEVCGEIMERDERLREKFKSCNSEYAAALDTLFMIIGEALNTAGVFKLGSVIERRVKV